MEEITKIYMQLNIPQLIAIGVMFWFFYNRLDKKIDKLESRVVRIEERMSRLENDMIEVKTVLRLKECCMIKDHRNMEKAE